jgi:membrane fusion protein (multidrug efflux system)
MRLFTQLTKIGIWSLMVVLAFQSCKSEKQQAPPPPEIQVVKAVQTNVPIHSEFVGQVYGLYDIPIRARVEGWLQGMYFTEGSHVNKGDHLYNIDADTYQAQVAAQLGMVAQAETELVKAQSDLARIEPLAKINAVSQSDLDAAQAAAGAAKAYVDATKANLDAARIQLSYTQVYSPISGIIGKTKAKVGEFVGRDPNPVILNTVSTVDTIRVQFFIPESQYLALAEEFIKRNQDKAVKNEFEDKQKELELILSNGDVFPEKGWVDFIDREVDPSTGSLLIQASFPNPERILRPGQFAKVRALLKEIPNAILIPQRCVMELQGQYSVFTVSKDNVIGNKLITVGPTIGDKWLVYSGLEANEQIVYEGLQAVKIGMTINPKLVTPKDPQAAKNESDGK